MLCKAKKDYAKGEYQWVAQITKELVFADPSNQKAQITSRPNTLP